MDATANNTDIPVADGSKQRTLVLSLLRQGPTNSVELRQLGILNPSGRAMELKQRGHPVEVRILPSVFGPSGTVHRNIAEYRLAPDGE